MGAAATACVLGVTSTTGFGFIGTLDDRENSDDSPNFLLEDESPDIIEAVSGSFGLFGGTMSFDAILFALACASGKELGTSNLAFFSFSLSSELNSHDHVDFRLKPTDDVEAEMLGDGATGTVVVAPDPDNVRVAFPLPSAVSVMSELDLGVVDTIRLALSRESSLISSCS